MTHNPTVPEIPALRGSRGLFYGWFVVASAFAATPVAPATNASPANPPSSGASFGGSAPFRPQPSPGGAPPAANPELEQALANAFGLPT